LGEIRALGGSQDVEKMLNAAPDPKSTPIRAIREQALGFELAPRRPHRGLGNLQLRTQADHPGQLAPHCPDPNRSRKWAAV